MNRKNSPENPEGSVIVECELLQPPEKVWRALTVPDLLGAWLFPNDIRPEIGGRFAFRTEPGPGGAIECEVLAFRPNRLLRYSWRARERENAAVLDSVVTFELSETAAGGTCLRVVHSGFALAPAPPARPARSVPAANSNRPIAMRLAA